MKSTSVQDFYAPSKFQGKAMGTAEVGVRVGKEVQSKKSSQFLTFAAVQAV